MSVSTNNPYNGRLLLDANFVATKALSGVTTAFDFVQATPYPTPEKVDVKIELGQTAAAGTASVYLQESSDNSSWANIAAFAAPILTQVTSGSTSITVKLEPDAERYFRVSGSTQGTGAGWVTASVLF